jgi:hypothetical protein
MTKSIAVTVAAAGAAAALFGGGAAGAQDGPRTISVISVEQSCRGADNGRRGDSVGDLDVCRGKLRDAATRATAGRAHWTCLYLGSTRAGSDCTATVKLRGGTLQAAGVLSHTSTRSTWAISGGTGSYAGARGTIDLRALTPTRTAATITLLP